MTRCAPCGATWGGLRIAHCAACHRTFTTPANFDKHRAGRRQPSNVVVGTGTCARPVDIGLVENARGFRYVVARQMDNSASAYRRAQQMADLCFALHGERIPIQMAVA